MTPPDWQADRALAPEIAFTGPPRTGPPRRVLLTGATGLLGAYVLHELLRATDVEVHCLVRDDDPQAAALRLRRHLARLHLDDTAHRARIVPLLGDLSQTHLGLPAGQFAALADAVDVIYHCGVLANFWRPYAALRAVNVLGTAEVLRLAGTGAVTPVHHVSTLAVFFDQVARGATRVHEDDVAAPSDALRSGYVRSKWVAEQLVQAAQDRGLPATIYRTSRICGASDTGATSNDKDLIVTLIRACVALGAYPEVSFEIALAPVDWVARAVVSLSRRTDHAGRAYHLVQPRPIAWPALVEQIQAGGQRLTAMAFADWRALLRRTAEAGHPERDTLGRLWLLLGADDTLFAPRPAHDTPRSGPHLAAAGLLCPPIDAGLIARWLAFFQAAGLLPAPPQNV